MLDYWVAAPVALVANALPFTPGGLGVGEAAFDQLARVGVQRGALRCFSAWFHLSFTATIAAALAPAHSGERNDSW